MGAIQEADGKDYLRALGQVLRGLRKRRSWSRRELATRSGVSERFLADIERGKANPSILRLECLAQALGTRAAQMLERLSLCSAPRSIALLGLRGAGKSEVGAGLAQALGLPFVELDADVERRMGLPLAEVFEGHGEAAYRRAERAALRERLDAREPCVLATGGGLVTEAETWDLLRARAHSVWLRAEPQDHWDRVLAQGDKRPMDGDQRAFANLCAILERREELYAQAEMTLETSGRSVEDLVCELSRRFAGLAGGV